MYIQLIRTKIGNEFLFEIFHIFEKNVFTRATTSRDSWILLYGRLNKKYEKLKGDDFFGISLNKYFVTFKISEL